jgi:hypothetical protein
MQNISAIVFVITGLLHMHATVHSADRVGQEAQVSGELSYLKSLMSFDYELDTAWNFIHL